MNGQRNVVRGGSGGGAAEKRRRDRIRRMRRKRGHVRRARIPVADRHSAGQSGFEHSRRLLVQRREQFDVAHAARAWIVFARLID